MNKIAVFVGGLLFGFGLAFSGMTKPEIVLSFLQLRDLGLLFVMGGAILVTFVIAHVAPQVLRNPIAGKQFKLNDSVLNKKTVLGAAIFGIGWGVSGLCPGSAIASIGTGNYPILVGIAAMFVGAYAQGRLIPS